MQQARENPKVGWTPVYQFCVPAKNNSVVAQRAAAITTTGAVIFAVVAAAVRNLLCCRCHHERSITLSDLLLRCADSIPMLPHPTMHIHHCNLLAPPVCLSVSLSVCLYLCLSAHTRKPKLL